MLKRPFLRFVALLSLLLFPVAGSIGSQNRYGPPVDILFCVDLSGSTNGIIERVRNHLWDYVHLFRGCIPQADFRIGFVGFSRPSFGRDNYYVKVISDLTHDMEKLNYEMYKLIPRIEKGDQFVGAALNVCSKNISWNERNDAIKIIFLCGNGMVTTGGENYVKAVESLVQKGITVYSIYLLNNPIPGEIKGWEDIATRGNGKHATLLAKFDYFENIKGFDMVKLFVKSKKLNESYIPYGEIGKDRWLMQKSVDESLFNSNSEGYCYRMQFRISDLYLGKNANWDLVDLTNRSPNALAGVDQELLPDSLRKISEESLRKTVETARANRLRIIEEIREMLIEKDQLVKEQKLDEEKVMKTFDITTIAWLRDALTAKGYLVKN